MHEVATSGGIVAGVETVDHAAGRAVRHWRGIPYAAPPVGEQRWCPPEPPSPWRGVRDGGSFGPSAPQRRTGPFVQGVPGMEVDATSEDCLTLNVTAPEGAVRRPVVVWVHGGAFVIGGASLATYDPTHLAAAGDLVVVSCNYRLGALGFLCLPGLTPNVGLLDLAAALHWVQREIAAFGGDPDRVTLVGESAGAGCIRHLLAAPAAAGLCRRAILQSPGADLVRPPAAGHLAAAFLQHAGVDAAGVRDLEVEAVLDAQDAAAAQLAPQLGAMPWSPVVDGAVVADPPVPAAVDVVLGTTGEELRPYATLMAQVPPGKEARALRGALRPVLGRDLDDDVAAAALAAYGLPAAADPVGAWTALLTDAMMRGPLLALADGLAASGTATYTYVFDWAAPEIGAAHAVDLPFTFGTFDVAGWGEFVGADDDAVRLSDDLIGAWAAFAATGDPATERTGPWPTHEHGGRATMVLGRRCGVEERAPTVRFDAGDQ